MKSAKIPTFNIYTFIYTCRRKMKKAAKGMPFAALTDYSIQVNPAVDSPYPFFS